MYYIIIVNKILVIYGLSFSSFIWIILSSLWKKFQVINMLSLVRPLGPLLSNAIILYYYCNCQQNSGNICFIFLVFHLNNLEWKKFFSSITKPPTFYFIKLPVKKLQYISTCNNVSVGTGIYFLHKHLLTVRSPSKPEELSLTRNWQFLLNL